MESENRATESARSRNTSQMPAGTMPWQDRPAIGAAPTFSHQGFGLPWHDCHGQTVVSDCSRDSSVRPLFGHCNHSHYPDIDADRWSGGKPRGMGEAGRDVCLLTWTRSRQS